jgi:hypothetical protein
LGPNECYAYNAKRSAVLTNNAKYDGEWRFPKMTTIDTKVATPCVPKDHVALREQHSDESPNYDNFEKCEEQKLEELVNRTSARHEQPLVGNADISHEQMPIYPMSMMR